jgi:hypothetical protein
MSTLSERRQLSFQSLDEAVAEAERLASGQTRTTGNHTFAQIVEHLATTLDVGTGKIVGPRPPLMIRLLMPLMKGMILNRPVKPGLKLPKDAESFFWPDVDVDLTTAMAHMRESVQYFQTNGPLAVHPLFGRVSPEQILALNCSHFAMHLSFVHSA